MKFDWRKIAHIGAQVASAVVPQAVLIEQSVENVIDAKSGKAKADQSLELSLSTLEAAAALSGRNYATPRVESAIRHLNDAGVELLNALAEAHDAAKQSSQSEQPIAGAGQTGPVPTTAP